MAGREILGARQKKNVMSQRNFAGPGESPRRRTARRRYSVMRRPKRPHSHKAAPLPSKTPMEWIFVVSMKLQSHVRQDRRVRLASVLLPEPGGPISKALCPPAAAISSARLANSCPLHLLSASDTQLDGAKHIRFSRRKRSRSSKNPPSCTLYGPDTPQFLYNASRPFPRVQKLV